MALAGGVSISSATWPARVRRRVRGPLPGLGGPREQTQADDPGGDATVRREPQLSVIVSLSVQVHGYHLPEPRLAQVWACASEQPYLSLGLEMEATWGTVWPHRHLECGV